MAKHTESICVPVQEREDKRLSRTRSSNFLVAADQGNLKLIEKLLGDGTVNVKLKNEKGYNALHIASSQGHYKIVKCLLNYPNFNINCATSNEESPLHLASSRGHLEVIEILLANSKCDVNLLDKSGNNALHLAASKGHDRVVKYLLRDPRSRINQRNYLSENALHLAVYNEHENVVKVLVKNPMCDVSRYNPGGINALHMASMQGASAIVKQLLSSPECDVNALSYDGKSALYKAHISGNHEVIELLLMHERCDIRLETEKDLEFLMTLLRASSNLNQNSKDKLQDILLHRLINITETDTEDPQTPHHKIVECLLNDQAFDINCTTADGDRLIHLASSRGHKKVLEILLANSNCDVNLLDKSGNNALHLAASNRHWEVVLYLLRDLRFNINLLNDSGESTLHIAISDQQENVVKAMLRDPRCDVSLCDSGGNNALHLASLKANSVQIVQKLLSFPGCDVNALSYDGKSALHKACIGGNHEVIQLLLMHERCDVRLKTEKDLEFLMTLLRASSKLNQNSKDKLQDILLQRLINITETENPQTPQQLINYQNRSGDTLLHYTCRYGFLKVTDHLFANKMCNKSIMNNRGETFYDGLMERFTECKEDGSSLIEQLVTDGTLNDKLINEKGYNALHIASLQGHHKIVECLLNDQAFDINCTTADGDRLIHLASSRGHKKVLEILLANSNCDVNLLDISGNNALHLAASNRHWEVVLYLLRDSRFDINLLNDSGESTLHIAISDQQENVVKAMLRDPRCDVSLCDSGGNNALHLASLKANSVQIVQKLLSFPGCDVNALSHDGKSALHKACIGGNHEVIELLLMHERCDIPDIRLETEKDLDFLMTLLRASSKLNQNSKDKLQDILLQRLINITETDTEDPQTPQQLINYQNRSGDTLLHYTCRYGFLKVTDHLFANKMCNKSIMNNRGETFYDGLIERFTECKEDGSSLIEQLVTDGTLNDKLINDKGYNALHIASSHGHHKIVECFLNDQAFDINCTTADGDRLIHLASSRGHKKVLEILLANSNCDVNLLDKSGNNALHLAASNRHWEVVLYLLRDSRFDINLLNDSGESTLHIAISDQQEYVVKAMLRDPRCDVSLCDSGGNNALHLASLKANSVQIVQKLLSFPGCDVNALSHDGKSALHKACIGGNHEVIELLLIHEQCHVGFESEEDVEDFMEMIRAASNLNQSSKYKIRDIVLEHLTNTTKKGIKLSHLVNHQNSSGDTLLHYACRYGFFEVVDHLFSDNSCNKSIKNNRGETFYNSLGERLTICEDREIELVVKRLQTTLKQGATKFGLLQGDAPTALLLFIRKKVDAHEFAMSSKTKGRFDLLIRMGESVKERSELFAHATNRNSFELCDYILQNEADVNSSILGNETALHCALRLDSFKKVALIMNSKPSLTLEWRGLTPLKFAIAISSSPEILELLSEGMTMKDIEEAITQCSAIGETPLTCSVRLGVTNWIHHFFTFRKASKKDGTGLKAKWLMYKNSALQSSFSYTCTRKEMSEWYKERSSTSVKLTPGKPREYDRIKVLETVQNCRRHFKQSSAEVNEVTTLTLKVLGKVSEELSTRKDVCHLAFDTKLAGSMAEGTKCYFPDEIDILCVFKNTNDLNFHYRFGDFFNIEVARQDSPWLHQSTRGLLEQGKVALSLYKEMEKILNIMASDDIAFGHLHLFKYSFLLRDKISGLQLLFRGETFLDMMVYVDLVPVFRLPDATDFKPVEPFPLNVECQGYYLIAKKSRHEMDINDCEFHVTTSTGERAVLQKLPAAIKDAFIFAKAMRLVDICSRRHYTEIVEEDGGVHARFEPRSRYEEIEFLKEPIRTEDYLTSYVLKNLLLTIVNNSDHIESQTPYKWAVKIYKALKDCLDNRAIPAWNSKTTGYLLYCKECKPDEEERNYDDYEACCKKRWLMTTFTDNILSWLECNKAELQKIQLLK